jgi:IS30 family transposase
METKTYVRLTLSERIIIETLLGEKKTKSEIAQKLKRTRKTIGNEINRWVGDSSGHYRAELAHGYSKLINDNKRTKDKITLSKALKMQVYRGLLGHLSPEMISGRLRLLYPDDPTMNISYETIYRYIYSHPQGTINRKLIKLLLHQKSRRRKSKRREGFSTKIREGLSIDNRPPEIEERQEVGHWEGDLVIGAKQHSCIGTLVERKTRYAILLKLPNKKSDIVCKTFSKALNKHPEEFRKTMTYDNGTEMAEHKELTRETGMSVYFAHSYSSWERGTNENTNGLVRRFYPKKTDFNNVSEVELKKLQDHLNNRPRKVLGYYTPKEMYYFEKRKTESYDNDDLVLEMGNKSLKDLFSFLIPQRAQQIEIRN